MSDAQVVAMAFSIITGVPALILTLINIIIKLRKKRWVWAEGEIIRNNHVSGQRGFAPTIQFSTDSNQTLEVTSRVSLQPAFRVGRKVDVYYNPKNPQKIVIDHFIFNGNLLLLIASIMISLYIFFFSVIYFNIAF
ncbi:DUF3592 domain-containing protein [Alkalicoccobacillus porphyridii]|nr:DUF3592 domain-containing protein [Alkalicoccobacillus porphyridii]